MAFNDGIKVGPIAYIGLVSVIVTFVLVLLLQVLYFQQRNAMAKADLAAEGPPHELTELRSQQQTVLTQRGYVDRERGIVAIGIKRAKELVITELNNHKTPSDVNGPSPPPPPPAKDGPAKEPAASDAGSAARESTDSAATEKTSARSEVKQELEDDKS